MLGGFVAETTQPYEGVKSRYLWVDVELLHWASHPDPEMRGKQGSFNLECLKLYVALCAEALRQAIRPKSTDLLIAAQTDAQFLESLGFATVKDAVKGAVNLGILKRLGLVREAYTEKKHDVSYSVAPRKVREDEKETEEQARDYTNWRMYEKYVEKYGDTEPEDFMKRLWSVSRCDGKPWNKNLPNDGVKQYIRLDWLLFQREGGKKTDEFMSLTPEELFLMILLYQGTRPFLTCSVHPTYIDRKTSGTVLIGETVRNMCEAAGFKTPIEEVLTSLIARGYFTWISLPLASQDAGKGGGGLSARANSLTVVANYDARHPNNLIHPKKRKGVSGKEEIIPPEELLMEMSKVVLAPTRGFYVDKSNPILAVLGNGEIDVRAVDDFGIGQPLLGRFPLPARSRT